MKKIEEPSDAADADNCCRLCDIEAEQNVCYSFALLNALKHSIRRGRKYKIQNTNWKKRRKRPPRLDKFYAHFFEACNTNGVLERRQMETVGAAIRQSPPSPAPYLRPFVAVISAIYRWQQLVTIASVSRHAHGYHKRGQAMSLCESRTKESLYRVYTNK